MLERLGDASTSAVDRPLPLRLVVRDAARPATPEVGERRWAPALLRFALAIALVHVCDGRVDAAATASGDRSGAGSTTPATRFGDAQQGPWTVLRSFSRPTHVGVVRARFGEDPTSGVPTRLRWERLPPRGATCAEIDTADPRAWTLVDATQEDFVPGKSGVALPRRSWFVDVDACALRLVVERTNRGAPVVRDLRFELAARDVLVDAVATDDGAAPGFDASAAIDGLDFGRWMGAPGRRDWTLTARLASPAPIDRVRVVLGADATSRARAGNDAVGRDYAIANGPIQYEIEASEDGEHWWQIASTPTRADGAIVPLRRRLVRLDAPRTIRALRLRMHGATDSFGAFSPLAAPIVCELAAYRSDDPHPVMPRPWLLSINANPTAQTHVMRGGERASDAYFARFLQQRFAAVLPPLARDDRYARSLDARGMLIPATRSEHDGEALESIEGDDPMLGVELLAGSSPLPIAVLSGSNDWDYGDETGPMPTLAGPRWRWDPLLPARFGGLSQLVDVVRGRRAPLIGFCGGAQLLALLEAASTRDAKSVDDQATIDAVVRRVNGLTIRPGSSPWVLVRAWPGERDPRQEIVFDAGDRLFSDLAGPTRRTASDDFPESHADAVSAEAFGGAGPLAGLRIVAASTYPIEPGASGISTAAPASSGGRAAQVPEVFREREGAWPIIGVQAHAERPVEFESAVAGEPASAVADPLLLVAAMYEEIVDAYVQNAGVGASASSMFER